MRRAHPCVDLTMGPAEGPDAVAGRVPHPGAGGVVARPALFERLGAAGRVTVVSAPPGGGKTVLLRSWIGGAGPPGRPPAGQNRPPQPPPRALFPPGPRP